MQSQQNKTANKVNWWLRIDHFFYDDLAIKRLSKMKNGYEMIVLYQKLMILSLENEGNIEFQHIYPSFPEEIAEALSESSKKRVTETLKILDSMGLIVLSDDLLYIPDVEARTGKITASSLRSRECRARKKALQCNSDATKSNTETETEPKTQTEPPPKPKQYVDISSGSGGGRYYQLDEIELAMQRLGIYSFSARTFYEHYEGQRIVNLDSALQKWDANRQKQKEQPHVEEDLPFPDAGMPWQ